MKAILLNTTEDCWIVYGQLEGWLLRINNFQVSKRKKKEKIEEAGRMKILLTGLLKNNRTMESLILAQDER